MKEHPRQQFRWQPHTSGVTNVKPRDYEAGEPVEGNSPYGVWMALRETEQALQVGDLLETESGELLVFKYVGFEEARWVLPEPKPEAGPPAAHGAAEGRGADCNP
jgi:hypothetical protein